MNPEMPNRETLFERKTGVDAETQPLKNMKTASQSKLVGKIAIASANRKAQQTQRAVGRAAIKNTQNRRER